MSCELFVMNLSVGQSYNLSKICSSNIIEEVQMPRRLWSYREIRQMFGVQQLYWILWAVYPTPAVFEGLRLSRYFPAKDSNDFLRIFTNK